MNTKGRSKKTKLPQQKKPIQEVKKNSTSTWIWFALAIILIVTFAIYFKAIKFGFLYTWDDNLYLTENSHLSNFQWVNIKLFFTNYYASNYQPVTMLFYAIEYKIGAGHASIFHFNNILLHLLNTFLVFVLIRRVSPKNAVVALITAAFFAVHPMHVESVAWISERKDVLYSFFFLLSLITYTDYLKSLKIKYLIYAAIFFLLSCLSKSAAVVLPLVMLLFDYYSNRKYSWKMIVEKLPFFTVSLIFGLVAVVSQKSEIHDMAPAMSVIEHLSVVSFSFLSYLFKAIVPVNLSVIYPYPIESGGTLPFMYYLSIFCIGLLLFFVGYSLKWGKDVVFGFLFFLITILLVLQFVPVGAATMADRYTYIPYIGLFFIIGKLYESLSLRVNANSINYKTYSYLVLVPGFITFTILTDERIKIWENDDLLFSDMMNKYPNNSIPYRNRGDYYLDYCARKLYANDNIKREIYIKKALVVYENALRLKLNPKEKTSVYSNISTAKCSLGDYQGAIDACDTAIKIDSSYENVYINRGSAKYMLEDYEGSIEDYNKAIELNPQEIKAIVYNNRGFSKYMLKDYKGAYKDYNKAIELDPLDDKSSVYTNRGSAKFKLGDYEGSIEDYNKAIELKPQDAKAIVYKNRGTAKYNLKDYKGAYEDYNKALELDPQDAKAMNNRNIVKSILENSNRDILKSIIENSKK